MPITLELMEQDRVIYYHVTDPAQLGDMNALHVQNQTIRDRFPHTIHAIVNLSEIHTVPADILSARHGSPNLNHPRAGLMFVVTTSIYVRSILEIIIRLANTNKIRIMRTEADAWYAVREVIRNEISEPS